MLKMTPERFTLDHPFGISISSTLNESSLPTSEMIEKRDMDTGYVWYDLAPTELHNQHIAMSLCFHHGTIHTLSIYPFHEDGSTKSWGDWSETTERQNTEIIKTWLTARGYPVGLYSWGEVWAGYDAKSASGYGGVRYNSTNQ